MLFTPRILSSRWFIRFHGRNAPKTRPGVVIRVAGVRGDEIERLLNDAASAPSRATFQAATATFLARDKHRRGHMGYVRGSLDYLDATGLANDLALYNTILDVFPRDRFQNRTLMDAIWPKAHPQIDCALNVLQKMEDNGVRPNSQTYSVLLEIFGRASLPVQKCRRIAYWFDRFETNDPYRVVGGSRELSSRDLARFTLERICGGEQRYKYEIEVVRDSDPFVTCAIHSVKAKEFHDNRSIFLQVTGPHRTWLQDIEQYYYVLLNQNQQDILSVATTDASENELERLALNSWLTHVQAKHVNLSNARVLFSLTHE